MYPSPSGQETAHAASVSEERAAPARRASPWPFFAGTFILSWLFWVPAAVLSQRTASSPPELLLLLGGFGPSIVGVAMVYWTQDSAGRLDYLRRAFSFRRIGLAWYAFITLVFPVLAALSIWIDVMTGNPVPFFPSRLPCCPSHR